MGNSNQISAAGAANNGKCFDDLIQEFEAKEKALLRWKAGDYTDDADRLLNFHQVADLTDTTAAQVALMYLLKHIQSITLAVQSGRYAWVWHTESREGLKQRIADARNYLLLLAACLDEEKKGESK